MRVVIISTIFTGLATIFVALRLWTRFKLVHSPGYDDILIVGALLSCICFFAFILIERSYGLGVNINDLSSEVIEVQMHYLWLSVPFYNLSLILSKLSALFLYTRIFRGRGFLLATYITMTCLILAGFWMVTSGFVFCVPISAFWELNRNDKSHCLPMGPVWYSNSAMQIVSDIVIMILPMPVLSKLQLPFKQKAGIILVFGLGVFVIATSSARLYELSTMVNGTDFTEKNAEAAVWSSLEANVSIICACMPPLHPLLSRLFALCFRPIPLHSSPASKAHSNTTCLTETRKPSIYDHHGVIGPDGGVFFNDFFYAGPGSYMASVANLENESKERVKDCENENGIRVVRELRMESDSVPFPNGGFLTTDYNNHGVNHDFKERDIEMGQIGEGSNSSGKGTGNPSIEWDLGDWEFPDYKERMNAPI
ncbi:hypothetical protein N7493_010936 [Penicillium malachiteum]|uniref:Rhodopsin domain-containing protein n=1 Tax=Penicillium malachiteum TaxID=1324776 RepID=A0AAD6HBF5_9EURO|nr:hypothetical protein N7493_010936 [Penicillium malachiteum]